MRRRQDSDDRDIIADFLNLLHTHSLDFHSSFRHLCTFDPTTAEDKTAIPSYVNEWLEQSGEGFSADSVDRARQGLSQWLDVYAARIVSTEEREAWSPAVNGHGSGKVNGSSATTASKDGWQASRKKAMKAVNPRFVLRQWVLEEVISDVEKAGWENVSLAREALARVLDVSHPLCRYANAHEIVDVVSAI